MGVLSDYIAQGLTFDQITAERKVQLNAISTARGHRDILVYAADMMKQGAPTGLDYSDLAPIADQLANLSGQAIDVILETPGGLAEVAEDVVRVLHDKYDEVAFIIPGWAKSAGTIMAMAGNEILMGTTSALGPIDAQQVTPGKQFSADAFLEGLEKIKAETDRTGSLNRAYIPILQGISPGEIQAAQNAMKFSRVLVGEWLAKYKFKNWVTHSGNGQPVTSRQRRARAQAIARKLGNHRRWLTQVDLFASRVSKVWV
jgi:ClpP class serine protease